MNGNGDPWPAELVEQLKLLHAEGLAFSKIAARLGVSRNAAIGRAKRLGLHRGHQVAVRPKVKKAEVAPKPKMPPPAAPKAQRKADAEERAVEAAAVDEMRALARAEGMGVALATSRGLPFVDLTRADCRWPLGPMMARPGLFCGAPVRSGKPYCADHCRLAYTGAPAPRARAS